MLTIYRNITILFSAGLILLILGCESEPRGPIRSDSSDQAQPAVPTTKRDDDATGADFTENQGLGIAELEPKGKRDLEEVHLQDTNRFESKVSQHSEDVDPNGDGLQHEFDNLCWTEEELKNLEKIRSEEQLSKKEQLSKEMRKYSEKQLCEGGIWPMPTPTPNLDIKEVDKIATEKVEKAVIDRNESSTTTKDQYQKYDNSAMPKLHNLGIMNLGPYNDANRTFGDLLFDTDLTLPIFIEFGATIDRGQINTYNNPTFEFRGPADTLVVSPIDGIVTWSDWQPSAGYVQDDWEVIISPSMRSSWGVSIDHVVSIDCDRKGYIPAYCDKPLQIDGVNLEIGTEVKIGDVIGYMGNWMENGTKINGRTEITLFQYIENYDTRSIDSVSYCPTLNIAEAVESSLKYAVVDLMGKYEMVHGRDSAYDESQMVAPGCRYSAIKENEAGGKSIK